VLGFTPTLGQVRVATPNPNSFQVLGFTPTLGQVRVATGKGENGKKKRIVATNL
jgi:hypothetical protein